MKSMRFNKIGRKISNFIELCLLPMSSIKDDSVHLDKTMGWLARAQDVCQGKGVSICYDLKTGWHPDPYPETSGYILETFLKYSDFKGNPNFVNRAISIGLWEMSIQREDGAVFSSVHGNIVRVFNTGQVILGLCCLSERTKNQLYLDAAIRSGDYLVSAQEPDGSWIKDTHCGARTYHSRVAWSLMRLAELTGKQRFLEAGIKNIQWVLTRQTDTGWFSDCGFNSYWPVTHAIGYTLRGLLECQQLAVKNVWDLRSSEIIDAVIKSSRAIMNCSQKYAIGGIRGLLPAAFDEKWNSKAKYSCLDGNAQIAICLMRLGHLTDDYQYFETASNLIDALKQVQRLDSYYFNAKGGLTGSFPASSGYMPDVFPNWTSKFMADALMMKIRYKNKWRVEA